MIEGSRKFINRTSKTGNRRKALILILLISGGLAAGCIGQAETQRYHLSTNSSWELILSPDNTFIWNTGKYTFEGKYKFDNDSLYLTNELLGTEKMTVINDSALIYDDRLYLKD